MSDANTLVKVFIKMRDAKELLVRDHEERLGTIEAQMALVEQELLELCKTTGQDGGKTECGTFTRSVKTRYWTSDWSSMHAFIKQHDALDMLERRIHQGNFKQFLQDNPDLLPEGVNVDSKYSITVRRASNR